MLAVKRSWVCLAVLVLSATSVRAVAPVPPGTSSLSVIPAQAPIVVHIHGVERSKDRLTTLIKNALPDLGILAAAKLDESLKEALEDRKLQGLEKDGPIFIAFMEIPGDDTQIPAMAIIARVSNYGQFRDGILSEDERKAMKPSPDGGERTEIKGQEVFFLDRAGWAIISPHKETAALMAKNNPGLDAKLNKDVARRFLESDVAVYVNLASVNAQYGDQIKQAKETLFNLFDQFGGQNQATMEMAKKIYSSIFQVVADGRAFVVGLDFRPTGLNLHMAANIGADTDTNKFLKDQKPVTFGEINTLPEGSVIYTATEFAPSLFKSMAPLIYGVAGDGDAQKSVKAAFEQLIEAGNTLSLSASSFPATALQISKFANPVLAVNAQLKLFRAMGDGAMFQNAAIKGKPEIKENAESYRGFTLHFAKVTWDLDKMVEQFGGAGGDDSKKAMAKLMGESLSSWFGTDGKQFITVSAKSWSDAKVKIDAYLDGKSTVGAVAAFADTRKNLPAEATMVSLADSGKFAMAMGEYMLAMVKALGGAGVPLPFNLPDSMKPVETKPAFIGVALVMQPEYGGFDFYLPVTAIHEIRKVIMPLLMGGE